MLRNEPVSGKTDCSLPVSHYHFDLSPLEFRDALALTIRYYRPASKLPAYCDDCGAEFTFQHALDFRKGDLAIQRYNEVRDAIGNLASFAFMNVYMRLIVVKI